MKKSQKINFFTHCTNKISKLVQILILQANRHEKSQKYSFDPLCKKISKLADSEDGPSCAFSSKLVKKWQSYKVKNQRK